jgi:hypothetical protein
MDSQEQPMSRIRLVPMLLATALLAACSGKGDHLHLNVVSTGNTSINNGAITVEDDTVTLHPDHAPNATIDSAGDFSVDGKPVDITPAQRALLVQYYAGAMAVREHGEETGKAGTAIAGDALKNAVSGLAGGDTKSAADKVQAQADKVKQAALKICDDLAQIRVAQNQLVGQLPAFKPYDQLVTTESVGECRKD